VARYSGAEARGAAGVRIAAHRLAIAAHVAVLAARDQHDRIAVTGVADPAVRVGIHARDSAPTERVRSAIAKKDLDLALVDEVGLLLLLVIVDGGLVARRKHDRIDPKRGHAKLPADLAK